MTEAEEPRNTHPMTLLGRASGACVLMLVGCLCACAPANIPPPPPQAAQPQPTYTETGLASWYGRDHDGQITANGERFHATALTAAHRDLPFGTVVRVTNLDSGRTVKVRINDRGPHVKGRIIDLSAAASKALGVADDGVLSVRLEVFAADQASSLKSSLNQ